ncbi:disease resistance protein RUN1-like [Macadamia integrifolia]|uniref:disease resistance protein RUN1-like n=1 Tax=Macadamia integrifolia TaxID=60698 RepID=UPI001C4F6F3F|nr:disease resistance protein RUN1-like [Macadamia integrifolia]XP_042483507.1 disease resistance protein RUN1-like [Macadamia integrifolia]
MAAHEMASSSSSRSFTYDVFLNFRGEDTRKNFTVFLHKALTAEGINVFTKQKAERTNTPKVSEGWSEEDSSDEDSSDEKEIQPVDAIGQSKISIVIFSEGYADRIKYLKDLVKIVECHRSIDQKILPIFYDVEPADVRNQTGSFEKYFRNHKERFDAETVESWIEASNVVGDMTGYDLKQVNGNRSKLVDLVVNWVFSEVISNRLGGVKNLIGIEACVKDLLSLLNVGSGDIIFVGICGISGIGKTTIAKALYNSVFKIFDKSCFLENIGEEELGPKGLVALQEQLLYKVSEKKVEDQIWNVYAGQQLINDRLKGEKVLLVLDDVTSRFQLDALAIEFIWCCPGSRVIITSRDEHILKLAKVDKDKIYRPKELDDNESLQLFSLYAFSSDQPLEDYEQLFHDVLHLVGGLAFTIEVLGSYFSDKREKKVWQNMILELK